MLNKNMIIILTGKIILIIVNILSIKLMTTLLSPEEIGKIYMFIVFLSFFILSFINPITQYFFRFMNDWKVREVLLDTVHLSILYFLILSLLAVLVSPFILVLFDIDIGMRPLLFMSLLFLMIFFQTLNQFIVPLLNMLHYRITFTILMVLTSIGTIFFGYYFIKLNGNYAENWIFGIAISNISFAIIGYFILKNKFNKQSFDFFLNIKRINKTKIKSILVFVLPLSVATLFMWLQNSGYRILVEQNISLEFLGFLGVGLAISSQIASTVESVARQYFHPIYYQQITNTTIEIRKQAIDSLINKVLPIYFMLAIFLTFFAQYVVEILVDEKYFEVYIFTAFGVWIEFFRMTTNLFGNISQSEINTKKFMTPYIIGSLLTIILVYFSSLSSEYKYYLPISLIIGGFFTMIAMYSSMKKLIDFKIDYKLLILSLFLSIPYSSVYFFDFERNIFINMAIVMIFGLYFLGTIFLVYKKGLVNDNS